MDFGKSGLSLFLFVTLCLVKGNCLSCYQCSPNDNNNCNEVKGPTLTCELRSASGAYEQLLNMKPPQDFGNKFRCLKVVSSGGGITAAVQTCIPDVPNVCEKLRHNRGNTLISCNTCDTDGCNGATSSFLTSSVTVLIISTFVTIYYYL